VLIDAAIRSGKRVLTFVLDGNASLPPAPRRSSSIRSPIRAIARYGAHRQGAGGVQQACITAMAGRRSPAEVGPGLRGYGGAAIATTRSTASFRGGR